MSNRQRLRAKIAEKRRDRQHQYVTKSKGDYSKGMDEGKVRSFRQQEEFGPKKFIKP